MNEEEAHRLADVIADHPNVVTAVASENVLKGGYDIRVLLKDGSERWVKSHQDYDEQRRGWYELS